MRTNSRLWHTSAPYETPDLYERVYTLCDKHCVILVWERDYGEKALREGLSVYHMTDESDNSDDGINVKHMQATFAVCESVECVQILTNCFHSLPARGISS